MLALRDRSIAEALRDVADGQRLAEWTAHLTGVVVRACKALGWPTAAKGHKLEFLPQPGEEYLGIDVMAFPTQVPQMQASPKWPMPMAVFELENVPGRVAYSLWKVLCVRADLRVVFGYRSDWDQVRAMVRELEEDVIRGFPTEQWSSLGDQIVLVTGSRGEGGTFPHGYFKLWRLNVAKGRFEKMNYE